MSWISETALNSFIRESNGIEGLTHDPTPVEIDAHRTLLGLGQIEVHALATFVQAIAGSRAVLRSKPGLDVRVGSHRPPPGGPHVREQLEWLLDRANSQEQRMLNERETFRLHVAYETLHPFIDGNGRSGRALWVWMNLRAGRDPFALGFLHRWYYDSLNATRVRRD